MFCAELHHAQTSQGVKCQTVTSVAKREKKGPLVIQFIHNASKMVNNMEMRARSVSHILNGIRTSYNVNLKLMLMNHTEITNNCTAAIEFRVSDANIRMWRQQY
jgi:hypothetical protein